MDIRNSPKFLSGIPDDLKVKGNTTKVLGLHWNTLTDELTISKFHMPLVEHTATKREILHYIAGMYDPLGLITPITLHGKVFLQKLWKSNISLDETRSPRHCEEWNQIICKILRPLSTLKIPRLTIEQSGNSICQIMIFCDASMKAYSTAVYLLVKNGDTTAVNLPFQNCV